MSTHTNNSSRQNHHDEPPPLPPPVAVASSTTTSAAAATMAANSSSTTTTTSDEEHQQLDQLDQDEHEHHHRTETGVPLNDTPASLTHAATTNSATTPSASASAASSSSVRCSSVTTDSNYSGYSSSSNKSGPFAFKNKGGGRSLDLRKLPIDTTLFRGKLKGRRRHNNQLHHHPKHPPQKAVANSAPSTTTPMLLNTFSSRVVSNASSIPSVLDDSDSTLVDDGTMMLMDDHDDHGGRVRQGAGTTVTVAGAVTTAGAGNTGMNRSSRRSSTTTAATTPTSHHKDTPNQLTKQQPQSSSSSTQQEDGMMSMMTQPEQDSLAARCLRSTCLRSDFSLQTQLFLSFGMVSTITIVLVMVICVAVSILSGSKVNRLTQQSLEELSFRMEGKMVRYVGEALSNRLLPDDIVHMLHNAIVDRLVGYPNYPGFENDTLTPFTNIYNQQRIYPVKGPSARLDWDLRNVISKETAQEHVQHRFDLYSGYGNVTTSHAAYTFQGTCNPQATTQDRLDWYPNCTDANNNITTGGIVQPVATNQHLFERMSDLTPLLKALYEDSPSMRDIGICFANDGAGSCFTFPAFTIDGRSHYISEGCDWMNEPNPYKPSQPIGTPEMMARCHPKGTVVYNREYNPLERSWCIDMALHPFSIMISGPFQDVGNPDHQLMLVGQAIYDPLTLEFVGCMFQHYTIANVVAALEQAKITPQSHVSVTRWDPQGTIGASTAWNWTEQNDIPLIHELNVGINTPDDFQTFYDLIDYTQPWDPQQVREIYARSIHHNVENGYFVAVHPMPQIPDQYDPHYRPQWLVVMSVSTEDMLGEIDSLQENVDDNVQKLVYGSLVAGCVGWGVVMALIIVVSRALTRPLKSMNQATNAIVNNFGGNSEKGICYNAPTNWLLNKCTPETEVSLVVTEFEKMVHKFSGSSKMAKAVQVRFTELGNHFCFEREFEGLYNSRHQDGSFPYSFEDEISNGTAGVITTMVSSPTNGGGDGSKNLKHQQKKNHLHLKHFGSILTGCQSHLSIRRPHSKKPSFRQPSSLQGNRLSSPLFIWIVLFIVAPLLISSVTISAIVTFKVSKQLTEVVDDGKDKYVALEKFVLKSTVQLRANWIGGKVEQRTRELHVINRYASWLLFGGLDRRDTFTKITSGAETCKSESNPIDCEYLQQKYSMCLESYANRDDYSFRYEQDLFFVCESHDTMPDGDRNWSLTFPDVSYSPSTTSWWDNVTAVPGSEKGSDAAGYDTTYDRLRVLSAIPVFQTIHKSASDKDIILMNAVAMEADGMVVGYQGCSLAGEAIAAFWQSTTSNHAYEIRPELCPNGKYGYDPRCRMFYNTGKELAESGEAELFVTSPYRFATDEIMTQTCTSPLRDPMTNIYVGQVFVDFQTDSILDILSANNTPLPAGGFPLLMAAHPEIEGLDAIIGPGFTLKEDSPKSIEEVVLRNEIYCIDASCERNKEEFGAMLERIRNSTEVETGNFVLRMDDGSDEQIFIAYAPVVVQTSHAENSSDFKRGVYLANNVIFFVALTETEASLVAAFEQVEDDMELTVDIGIAILSVTIVVATVVVVYISYVLTISITQPMLYFLELIQHINEQDDNEILSDFDTRSGSREVKNVANAMGTLHKIVKCANSAYFAGDIDKAYAVLSDSARLFKRLDNKKAVGVANNNLGNTMLAMYRMMKLTAVERYCGMTRREVVLKGMAYFHIAIQLGEKAYDEFHEAEGWSPSCLDFMQHLANRYFNRAMFLLTVKGDHDNPKELEDLGFRDLQIARDMDVEIIDQGTEVGWKVNTVEKLFNVSLNRVRGHLLLLEMGYPDDWDLEELLEELFSSLKKELKSNQQTSALFRELSPAGRMQQVETELMRYKVLKGDLDTASKIAVRMLMEDEFILPHAQIKAVQVLLRSIEKDESRKHLKGQLKQYESWLRNAKVKCDVSKVPDEEAPDEDVTEVIMMSIAKLDDLTNNDDESSYEDLEETKKTSLLATTRGDVTMEIF